MKIKAGTDIQDSESGLRLQAMAKEGHTVLRVHQYCKSVHRIRDIKFDFDGNFIDFGHYDRGG